MLKFVKAQGVYEGKDVLRGRKAVYEGKAVAALLVRGRYAMSALYGCKQVHLGNIWRSLRPYMVQPSAKNAFHCEIFTQKFVRMVFVSYLCNRKRQSERQQAASSGSRSQPRCGKRVYTCADML